MVRLPRERRWEHLLPPENVPEYRRPWANFSASCAAHGLAERPLDAATVAPARRVFLINTYNNETDLLHMKLDEAYPVVDYIVLVEGARTFQYRPKPIHFSFERDTEFRRYHDKIIHHVYDFMPRGGSKRNRQQLKWLQEQRARLEGYRAIKHLVQPGDLIISADVDEIIRREALQLLRDCDLRSDSVFPIAFYMTLHYFSFQWHAGHWKAPFAVPFDNSTGQAKMLGAFDRMAPRKTSRTKIRGSGWHCSWFLTTSQKIAKLKSFSHSELNRKPYTDAAYIEEKTCHDELFFQDRKITNVFEERLSMDSYDIVSYVWRNAARLGWMLPGRDGGMSCQRNRSLI